MMGEFRSGNPVPRRRESWALSAACLLLLFLIPVSELRSLPADYLDPYGLPSGSASLKIIEQGVIGAGTPVQGFDFATGEVDSLHSYAELIALGEVDLLFMSLTGDSLLRAPEDTQGYDRPLIDSLGMGLELEDIASMTNAALQVFAPADSGRAYVMLQIQADAGVETTAVKFKVTAIADSILYFDWVWQPNGSLDFIPTATERSSFSELKARFSP